jgi:hypothetical protein
MPSCELPAMRMTASLIFEIFGASFDDGTSAIVSLMGSSNKNKPRRKANWRWIVSLALLQCYTTLKSATVSNSNDAFIYLTISYLQRF